MKPDQPDLTSPDGERRAANEPVAGPETMPSLEELLREAELKAAEHHDAWLRAKAEAENVRKRASDDVARAHKYGIEKFAADLLPVKDSLEAALAAENATPESLRSGVELTLKQLRRCSREAIREIDPAGQHFDPHQHQAIAPPSDKEPNTVITCCRRATSCTTGCCARRS